jgi:hypothetical protein
MLRKLLPPRLSCYLTLLLALSAVAAAGAARAATSDLLLPYFEVQLEGPGPTTLLAVVNTSDQPVPVRVTVYSNWGVEVLAVPLLLEPDAVQSINLRDWLVDGDLPQGQALDAAELQHVAAALCGEPSPADGLRYASTVVERRAVGYVTVRTLHRDDDVLVGDWFVVRADDDLAQGDALVDVDPAHACGGGGLCRRHALRFLEGGAFDAGTEIIVWTGRARGPSAEPLAAAEAPVRLHASAFAEPGVPLGVHQLDLLPVQVLRLADLGLDEPFGWVDLVTEEASWVGVRYSAAGRFSVGLASACLRQELTGAGLRIEKFTNGADADAAPGVLLAPGSPVVWEYVVVNTGTLPLDDVVVVDDDPSLVPICDGGSLAPGESLVCTARGVAGTCGYRNVGAASGVTADGQRVAARDASHYFADVPAALGLRMTVNGQDAREFPGPHFPAGTPLTLHWTVTNAGASDLEEVAVRDGEGAAVACPRGRLAAGESMTCTSFGVADGEGGRVRGRAEARGACGSSTVAEDVVFFQCGPCVEDPPSIRIEKATNGHDADAAPGPQIAAGDPVAWTYVVTNDGAGPLHDVEVEDDDAALSVSCPKSSLAPGESMTCTALGTAGTGPYVNLGKATAKSACDEAVLDVDPSHYTNQACASGGSPSLGLEKSTNGHDADAAPGPEIAAGEPVLWTYVVTNHGDAGLTGVEVADDDASITVSCPKATLAAGESMTCTASGVAVAGQYANLGTARGESECGNPVATDASHYHNQPCAMAAVALEKFTNGVDADSGPGPEIAPGAPVTWTYKVTNTGAGALTGIMVEDDDAAITVLCPKSSLAAGEMMVCTASGVAVPGSYSNLGMVTAQGDCDTVSDTDPSHYHSPPPEEEGDEGCTPGYWKNHADSWSATGYATGQPVSGVFAPAAAYPAEGAASLIAALGFGGGAGVEGGVRNLLRAAVAALLNASHPGVDHPGGAAALIAAVDAALASGDRGGMLALAAALDADNNLGCPLN